MNSTGLILIILLIVYIPIWIWARRTPKAREMGLETWGPALKINTHLGLKIIDRLARYRRFWHAMGLVSQVIAFILMVMMLVIMINAVIRLPTTMQSSGIGIEYALALPGLNPLMPFWFTLLGFIIALVFHEMAHGIQSRANDIGVTHTGLLYGVVPLGAFVEPDEADIEKASRRAKLDVYAAGITANFIIAVVAFILVSPVMVGTLSSPYEDNAGVYANTDSDGIPVGSMITHVDGQEFVYADIDEPYGTMELWGLGTPVAVTYDTEDEGGLTKIFRWGVYIATIVDDSAAEGAGLTEDDILIGISDSEGAHYFYSNVAFTDYMSGTEPDEKVTLHYYQASTDSIVATEVTLGSNNGIGFLGIATTTCGMQLLTPDDIIGVATDPFYNYDGLSDKIYGMLSYITHPFQGFTPLPEDLQWWYDEPFSGFWELSAVIYWIFWLNILLGITNALPAVPFDGGFIFRGWVDKALEKMGKKDAEARERQTDEITRNVSTIMLVLLIIVVVVAII